jgi:protease IV
MDALTRDFYEERRRRWRRSAFWRGFLVAALIAAVVLGIGLSDTLAARGDHIARFEVSGVITDDPDREALLAELAARGNARALVLRVNSPGGTTVGSEALFEAIRDVAAEKPVVAVMGEVAASGGYLAALAADHIIGRGNSLTGSIGVIVEYPDLTELLDRLGVAVETVRSSELKAEPAPWRPTNPAARAAEERMVAESFAWFRGLVGQRRGLSGEALARVATGGVFTGRTALENGLIDAIGGEAEALAWLESQDAGLGPLPVRDWAVPEDEPALSRMLGRILPSGGIFGGISGRASPKLYSLVR